MTCRICLEEGELIQPCNCTGTTAHVHEKCLLKWLHTSSRTDCEICKYNYEFIDVEEEVGVCCPKWELTYTNDATAAVVSIGILGHFIIMFFTVLWGTTTEDIFIYGNILQGIMIVLLRPHIRPGEVIVFWKCCSVMCLLFASFVQSEWKFFVFELIALLALALHTHARLVSEHKQTVRYINIVDRSLNDEVVQGP